MLMSLIGGALIAVSFLVIAALRGGAAREPKPFWARGEGIESMVILVCFIALGFALVVSSVSMGLVPLLLGLAVAFVGSVIAVALVSRRSAGRGGAAAETT
jgi:hypothetical protein